MEYDYPLDYTWSTDEIITVIDLFNAVEQAYEEGISSNEFLVKYNAFKKIVDSKSEEKQIDNSFKEISGYSIYQVVKASKDSEHIKLGVSL